MNQKKPRRIGSSFLLRFASHKAQGYFLKLRRCHQKMTKAKREHYRMSNKAEIAGNRFRKARTRTLIQLGGLVEKAGLFETLGLIPGADLQKDDAMQPIALGLLGALLELKSSVKNDEASMTLWKLKAQEFLDKS